MAVRPGSHAAVAVAKLAALEEVLKLLEHGPSVVTVRAVGERIHKSEFWVYKYLGRRDELLRLAVAHGVGLVVVRLALVDPTGRSGPSLVQAVIDALLPRDIACTAGLWLLRCAGEHGHWGTLSSAIATALAPAMPSYMAGIGGGILGALRDLTEPRFTLADDADVSRTIYQMTVAVALFDAAAHEKGLT